MKKKLTAMEKTLNSINETLRYYEENPPVWKKQYFKGMVDGLTLARSKLKDYLKKPKTSNKK